MRKGGLPIRLELPARDRARKTGDSEGEVDSFRPQEQPAQTPGLYSMMRWPKAIAAKSTKEFTSRRCRIGTFHWAFLAAAGRTRRCHTVLS
jgi:hypothetical protein